MLTIAQRCRRLAVDVRTSRLAAETKDGRSVVLDRRAIDADHLDHGYAVTVHRAQGATYDRAHVLAAGGGRELAYVAMSRARHGTTLHAVADDLAQARHDLTLGWTNDQHQRWITRGAGLRVRPASSPEAHPTTPKEPGVLKGLDDVQEDPARVQEPDFGLGL